MIRFYEPIIWHQRGIRSHSVFNDRSYAMPVRRREPVYIPPRTTKYSSYHDYGIDDSINRADYLSNAVLEDTFEAASRSRGKDHALLRNVNAAIDSTERHVTPRVAAISRRVRASTLPPVPRTFPVQQQVYRQPYNQVAESLLDRQSPSRPVIFLLSPNDNDNYYNDNAYASDPVVLSQAEVPWYLRARASSIPPPDYRNVRAASQPPKSRSYQPIYTPPTQLTTANLWAHSPLSRRSSLAGTARARSVEPSLRPYLYGRSPLYPSIPSSQLWAHRPNILSKDVDRLARARTDASQFNPGGLRRSVSVPHNFDKASDYYGTIPSVQGRALSRYLYAHRGRFGKGSKPQRPSLEDFPLVYVPWKGVGPSNRSKAAVIGNKLEAATNGVKPRRRPRSEFAANKLRELKIAEIERKYSKF
uniref:Uncharacterized protein n=1 Tax=Arion vulgaris TaxID=1028688 RepID=A0A0B7ACU9_9EUPU